MKKYLYLLFFISLAVNAANSEKGHRIPELNDVIIPYGAAKFTKIKNTFSLLSWNIYKGKKDSFSVDYKNLISNVDVVVLQEFLTLDELVDLISQDSNFRYIFATAFEYTDEGTRTGVINGGPILPLRSEFIRTTNREPILRTPKMSLVSIYEIEDCPAELMVVNTHAINFVINSKFNFDIEKIAEKVQDHIGPIVWAGDFNTWNKGRLLKLQNVARRLGLTFAKLKNYDYVKKFSGNPLDHILYKGLSLISGEVIKEINSSDHKPLTANFYHSCSGYLARSLNR